MPTTRELLTQFKAPKQPPVRCKYCSQIFTEVEGFTSRPSALENVEEIGIECPGCKHFFHSHFMDEGLKRLRPAAKAQRRLRRPYEKQFKRFQKRTRARLKMKKVGGEWLRKQEGGYYEI